MLTGSLYYQTKSPSGVDVDIAIFCHGLLSKRDSRKYASISKTLYENKYICLSFDFTGHGSSEGSIFWDLSLTQQLYDIYSSIIYLSKLYKSIRSITLIGTSLGGTAAFIFSGYYPNVVDNLILIAPRFDFPLHDFYKLPYFWLSQFRYNLKRLATKISIPCLIIQAEEDGLVDNNHVRKIFHKMKSENKIIEIISKGMHRLSSEEELDQVNRITIDWILNRY